MRRRTTVILLLAVVFPSTSCAGPAGRPRRRDAPRTSTSIASPSVHGTPTASSDAGTTASFPTVGALFDDGATGAHSCTASVIASSSQNTVMTAAHCIHGSGGGELFIPAYRRGVAPYGTWRVTGAYVSPLWQHDLDPHADYAVLTVAPRVVDGRAQQLAELIGSEHLGASPRFGSAVTLVAYNHGIDDVPIVCRAPVYSVAGYPTIDCHGFSGGTSGSPWLTVSASGGLVVHGVIGGRFGGGCHEYTSHTSSFTADVGALVDRAERGATPDSVRTAGATGC